MVTLLVAKSYYAHGAQLAWQTLVNAFEQVHQACLYVLPGRLNRLNTHVLFIGAPSSAAQYLATVRYKNTYLTPPIPVTTTQPATLLADGGRKKTCDRKLVWLENPSRFRGEPELHDAATESAEQYQGWHTQVELKFMPDNTFQCPNKGCHRTRLHYAKGMLIVKNSGALAQYFLQKMQVDFKFFDEKPEAQQPGLSNKNTIKQWLLNTQIGLKYQTRQLSLLF
jgi:hypothetical protein